MASHSISRFLSFYWVIFTLCNFASSIRSRILSCRMWVVGTLTSISSSCFQKRVKSTVSSSPRISQYTGPSEPKRKCRISFLPWVGCFAVGSGSWWTSQNSRECGRHSIQGSGQDYWAMMKRVHWVLATRSSNKMQSVNVLLQLYRCGVMRDDSQPFRVLAVLMKGTTNGFPWSTSLWHFCTLFLGFAQTARSILALSWTIGALDHGRSFSTLSNFVNCQ